MKKQLAKITFKTDRVVTLSKHQTQNVIGGLRPRYSDKPCPTLGYC